MKRALVTLAALAAAASPAWAKEKIAFVETAAVKDKPVVVLDPSKAYVLLRSDVAIPLHLMRIADAEDQRKYDALKAEAYAEAREKYAKKQAAYDKAKAYNDRLRKGDTRMPLPEQPVEPTEANFEFTHFGLLTGVAIGPLNRFAKGSDADKTSTYVQAVTPGEYRVYGLVSVLPNGGAFGSCFCMGSVRFAARAGEITDLGRFVARELPKREGSDNARPAPLAVDFRPADGAAPLDPRLAALKVQPAVFRPVGKLPNFWGLAIDRFPQIDGVMRYDRDRIVDLTAAD